MRRKTYGLTKEEVKCISNNTKEAYLSLYEKVEISKEELNKIGLDQLYSYTLTKPKQIYKDKFIFL